MDPTKWPPSSKPYFMLAIDTSGSMSSCTNPYQAGGVTYEYTGGFGSKSCPSTATANSCGLEPTRLNDAKCAVRKTIQAYAGEVNFGLMTYGRVLSGCTAGTVVDNCTAANGDCSTDQTYGGNGCTVSDFTAGNSCGNNPDCNGGALPQIYNGQTINGTTTPPIIGGGTVTLPGAGWVNGGNVVVDLLKDTTWSPGTQPASNVPTLLAWVDNKTDNSQEIFASGSTPLEGILRTAHQYYAAGWSSAWHDSFGRRPRTPGNYCATGGPTIDHPSPLDTTNDRPCRSLNVILVTDGDETCGGTPVDAATALYKVGAVIQGVRVSIKTYVIGFAGATKSALDAIAAAGGTTVSYSANNEVDLSQALATIIASSASPETCDNSDNNCNGCIDEGSKLYCNRNKTPTALATLQSGSPTVSQCCQWTTAADRTACLNAYSASITAANPKGSQWFLPCWDAATDTTNITSKWLCSDPGEVCDNKDNNCETQIDSSQSASFASNQADENQLKCGSPAHCPVAETCNQQDDDCDGVTDNASGSGVPFSVCPNGCVPTQELCNGCDDDCDGIADNGIPSLACGFSPPANCAGTKACPPVAVSAPGACIPGVTKPGVSQYGACSATPASSDTTCDNLDDNCNGVVDEGAQPTPCDNGFPALVYKDTEAASQCVKGLLPCHGTTCSGWVGPSPEICDGIDNDCNGKVDDGVSGVGVACGTTQGICTKGTTACVGGAIVCQGGTQPQPEVCDGIDNNCNGQTDEAPLNDGPAAPGCWTTAGNTCTFTGAKNSLSWTPPTGATCSGTGTLTAPCQAGALTCQGASGWACIGSAAPSSEVCDGIDNNCNGQTDENNPGGGGNCGSNVGACKFGTLACTSGKLACQGGTSATPEVCDGIDNDCNGVVDDNIPGLGQVCGSSRGTCKTGLTACVNGALVCQGEVKPGVEICDGKDNDCDGAVDDNPTDAPTSLGCWNLPGTQCSGGGKTWSAPPGATCTGVGTLTTPCSAGTLACAGTNGWVCQGGVLPGAEVCDGVDNNCNGQTDEGNPGGGASCGSVNVGTCKAGTMTCTGGVLLCQGSVGPTQELCDNLDNDCNGKVDDNITAGVGNPCGSSNGICKKGVTACVAGAIQCQGGVLPGTETCNGLDDDCNGVVDDNLTDGPANPNCWTTPGTQCSFKNVSWSPPAGATCTSVGTLTTPCKTGALTCRAGTWQCLGDQGPNPELCNGIDDNCNGQTDENNPGGGASCGSSTGECKPGVQSCVNGVLTCNGGTGPTPEICDGKDNNCDGQVDEPANLVGVGQICGSSVGTCKAGVTACVNGGIVCQGEVKASPEICDGKDNDCNGSIDDHPTDGPADPGCWNVAGTTCGFGAIKWDPPPGATCTGLGTLTTPCTTGAIVCQNGGWQCQGGRLPSGSEVCNGIDDNCNGQVDEGNPGGGASCGKSNVGTCQFGQITCTNGQLVCQGEVGPVPELCDGKDNDCNGVVDDNAPGSGRPCGNDLGLCTKGLTACVGGALVCQGGNQPSPEVCDGKDNDCNGLVDDGTLGDAPSDPGCWNNPGTTCSYESTTWSPPDGATCTGLGSLSAACSTGKLRCNGQGGWSCIGGRLPSTEVCNGQDDDCNGVVDNGDPGGGASCGIAVGQCTQGTQHCVSGIIQCTGGIGPTKEVCNGKDDDCDGQIDNGIPLGDPCEMPFDKTQYPNSQAGKGECRPGALACDTQTGTLVCLNGVGPQPEVCDGKDNDCDGQIDEAGDAPDGINGSVNPVDSTQKIGDSCGSSVGACKPGTLGCVAGAFACLGGRGPQREVCDCVDNNCDGQVDENTGNSSICGGSGTQCVKSGNVCQCASQCAGGEFPCPTGTTCQSLPLSNDGTTTGAYCVSDPCGDCSTKTGKDATGKVECGPAGTVDAHGNPLPVCTCHGSDGCHGPCYGVGCDPGFSCAPSGPFAGECRPSSDCRFFGCGAGLACKNGACVKNPCDPDPCGANEVCKPNPAFTDHTCVGSCAGVTCKSGERCESGKCVATGCGVDCTGGKVCLPGAGDGGGACGPSRCKTPVCSDGSYCDPATGSCINDPCAGVACPTSQVCTAGECVGGPTGPGAGGAGGQGGATGTGGLGGASGESGTGATDSGAGAINGAGGGGPSGGSGAGNHGGSGTEPPSNEVIGLATGGGGCRCDLAANGRTPSGALALGVLAMAAFATRRRARKEGGAR
jgi:hypothetical protein